MKAVLLNREYTVDEVSAEEYRRKGYDIYTDDGILVSYGAGQTVSKEKYCMLEKRYENIMAENARLTAELESLKAKKSSKK